MKQLAIGLCCVLSLLACTNQAQQAKPKIYDEEPSAEQEGCVPARDTIETPSIPSPVGEAPEKSEEKVKASPSSSSSYSPRSHQSNVDNMRGFDPASEDDMDDNGMSRYMEANDDEGWD